MRFRRTAIRRCAGALLLLALASCASAPVPAAGLRFALMGDTPYSQAQANLLDALIERVNGEPLSFAVHVGDITSGNGPCDDEWLEARQRQFARIRHPFVLLPGDNEWTDCHRTGFEPRERLAKWRSLFCVPVALPGFRRAPGEPCEHARWEMGGALFVALNVPGSNNNLQDEFEHEERMQRVFAWLDEAHARLRAGQMLVVLMHANPFVRPRGGEDGFAPLRERLRRLAEALPRRVLLVHGDTHRYRDDEPLPGLRRIEVPGAPQVRWLRASFAGGALQVEPADPP